MIRRVLRGFAVPVLLLPCAAVIVLWAWSYRTGVMVNWRNAEAVPGQPKLLMIDMRSVVASRGYVAVQVTSVFSGYVDPQRAAADLAAAAAERPKLSTFPPTSVNFAGYRVTHFGVGRYAWRFQGGMVFERWVLLPCWALLVASAAPVGLGRLAAWRRRRRTRRRLDAGQCVRCGYDLRGSPGERCPECGQHPGANVAQQPATASVGNATG